MAKNNGGFESNPQNINRNGRPKKIATILKDKGYKPSQIRDVYGQLAFYSVNELKEVYEDESQPIISRIIANQFFQALKKADYSKIREIIEQTIGKPKQSTEVEQTGAPTIVISEKYLPKE
jgi:hypothetical protein